MPSLDQLEIGQRGLIEEVEGGDSLGQRLLEMGLLEGEPVEVLGFAPFGDPMEVRLRDYRLSLRKREAARVQVQINETAFAPRQTNRPSPPAASGDTISDPSRPQESTSSPARTGLLTVALVGNPNTGKTTLFNSLTGLRHRVGNYPGVTVETLKGITSHEGQSIELIDLPGTYSLAPRSPDELLAVELVLGRRPEEKRPDVILSIVDASNLERNLYLTSQLLEAGIPIVVALNMSDIAQEQGLVIDAGQLSQRLGVPVVPTVASKHQGLEELRHALVAAAGRSVSPPAVFPEAFEQEVSALASVVGPEPPRFMVRRLLLDVNGETERLLIQQHGEPLRQALAQARARLTSAGCPVPDVEARSRYGWVRERVAGCVQRPEKPPISWTDRIDSLLTHRVWGTLIFLGLMFAVFQAIFTGAVPLMDLIKSAVKGLGSAAGDALPPGPLTSLLVDGVIGGVGGVIVFLPQILILFAFIAILEDCGYMARVAYLMDRLMARCGLSGKSFLPMLSSVACAVPGIMATRVIENRRDRLATILVAPLMSCSARLPVYTLLIAAFLTDGYPWWVPGLVLFSMYLLGIVLAPLVAFFLKRTLLRGETPAFVMEMPLYKWPSPGTVLRRMGDSGWEFLRRAGTIIVAAMIIVWALLYFPRGNYDQQVTDLRREISELREEKAEPQKIEEKEQELNQTLGEWRRQSWLGRMGQAIEPIVWPLGWDWKIGMAALASFPAREVIVGTLRIIYNLGEDAPEPEEPKEGEPAEKKPDPLQEKLQGATHDSQPERKVFTVPVALSIMVFFALCCQCASTLAVIRRETRSWGWPIFTFVYMTLLAYIGALITYQVGTWLAS